MSTVAATISPIVIVLLLVQGVSCMGSTTADRAARWLGGLNILLGTLTCVLYAMALSDMFVLSPEFGILIVQGRLGWWLLALVIAGTPVATGLVWYVARELRAPSGAPPLQLVAGLCLGVLAATQIQVLNPSDLAPMQVYFYDLWFPPLLIWIVVCTTDAGLALMGCNERRERWCIATIAVAGVAVWALYRPELANTELSPAYRLWAKVSWYAVLLNAIVSAVWIPPWQLWTAARGVISRWRSESPASRSATRFSAAIVAVAVMIVSIADPFRCLDTDPVLNFVGCILAWIVLCEVATGALGNVSAWWTQRVRERGAASAANAASPGAVGASPWTGIKSLLTVNSTWQLLLKSVMMIAVAIVLAELPNAGKTIVQPFHQAVSKDGSGPQDDLDLGTAFSDRLVNELGALRDILRPEASTLLAPSAHRTAFGGTGGSSAETALGQQDIQVSDFKVPLRLILTPIDAPIRRFLGVRIIDGTVQVEPSASKKRFTVLASSSAGEAWRGECDEGATTTPSSPGCTRFDAVTGLAFNIFQSDPTLRAGLITDSYNAFQNFTYALDQWRKFRTVRDYDALNKAIDNFRSATIIDPGFALAQYRLGLALRDDGQPGLAVAALRTSLRTNPDFTAAELALARTLYFFDSYHYERPAILPLTGGSGAEEYAARAEQARTLWQHVLQQPRGTTSLADRAAAAYELCNETLDEHTPHHYRDAHYAGYFYCRLAQHAYAASSEAQRKGPGQAAAVLSILGDVFAGHAGPRPIPTAPNDDHYWHCQGDEVAVRTADVDHAGSGDISPRRYWSAALRYYEGALALTPDDQLIRCNVAAMAEALGNPQRMAELNADPAAHVRLAERYRSKTSFAKALEEYSKAINRDPSSFEALNASARTVWLWYTHARVIGKDDGPGPQEIKDAADYAERALVLAKNAPGLDATARRALGEIRLAQNDPEKAVEQLQKVVDATHAAAADTQAHPPKTHPFYYEAIWDLAQARLCLTLHQKPTEHPTSPSPVEQTASANLLHEIDVGEAEREFRPFSSQPRDQLVLARQQCLADVAPTHSTSSAQQATADPAPPT
jgi:tetratricopeptide (TPR) repeat protein